jgi:5-methylcytosine-specific restriction enzyme subunit McrC
MLALLFDMNSLWEEYILIRLKQVAEENGFKVYGQNSKEFWKNISIRPDIVLEREIGKTIESFIIDTKWKNIDNSEPSTNDLRQMYVYNEYWDSKKAMLLYPSNVPSVDIVEFTPFTNDKHFCSLGKISIFNNNTLDNNIGLKILNWFGKF